MRCPSCGDEKDRVVDSRTVRGGRAVRRRRRCTACGHRFTTCEYVEPITRTVVKRDGRRESFSREKLVSGVLTACEKRPVSRDEIEALVDRVEMFLGERGEREVASDAVGEAVLRELRLLDEVAYVRFASVYRRFMDIGEFLDEVRSLLD